MTPTVTLSIGGNALSGFNQRALSGTISEHDGGHADELRFAVSNFDGALAKPAAGQVVTVTFGWAETGVVKGGQFTVLEVTKRGPAATFEVTAHSADLLKTLKQQKTRSWTAGKTLGDVLSQVAGDNGLTAAVDASLRAIPIDKVIAQIAESDMHLLTRLSRVYAALFKVTTGQLIFVPRGAGTTASGQPAGTCVITPQDCEEFSIEDKDRPQRSKANAVFYDRSKARRNVTPSTTGGDGDGAPDYTHPHLFGSQTEAQNHANARKGAFDRGAKSLHVKLAVGRVGAGAGGVATTQGFGDDDDMDWAVKTRLFAFGPKGNFVHLDCESKGT
jgi:phage protein D